MFFKSNSLSFIFTARHFFEHSSVCSTPEAFHHLLVRLMFLHSSFITKDPFFLFNLSQATTRTGLTFDFDANGDISCGASRPRMDHKDTGAAACTGSCLFEASMLKSVSFISVVVNEKRQRETFTKRFIHILPPNNIYLPMRFYKGL